MQRERQRIGQGGGVRPVAQAAISRVSSAHRMTHTSQAASGSSFSSLQTSRAVRSEAGQTRILCTLPWPFQCAQALCPAWSSLGTGAPAGSLCRAPVGVCSQEHKSGVPSLSVHRSAPHGVICSSSFLICPQDSAKRMFSVDPDTCICGVCSICSPGQCLCVPHWCCPGCSPVGVAFCSADFSAGWNNEFGLPVLIDG